MPDKSLATPGLLNGGLATGDGIHLYHETLPALVVYTKAQEADARAKGYTETYVFQEYPKQVLGQTANNSEQEIEILAKAPAKAPEFAADSNFEIVKEGE